MCAGPLLGQVTLFTQLYGGKVIFATASDSDCDPAALLIRYWRDKRAYHYGLRHADLVLAQTPEQQSALLKNFRRDSRVVPPLTDVGGRRPSFAEREGVLWVANMRPLKRPALLLEAARRLPQLTFHIIGGPVPGAENFYAAVREEALQVANVRFHGAVPYHGIGEFFERCRVFVGTSEIEGFPNTYLQAWSRGAPVAAFLDPEQLIARNGMGRAVSTISELCEAIVTLHDDAHAWETASQRCREYMDNRFNPAKVIAPYIEAVAELHAQPAPIRES
jgi:glycosyltransferase involved in cell wall biosynthesis